MKTTYQLTAEDMIAKYGHADALTMARKFSRKGRDKFWGYVAVYIEREAV